MKVTAEQIPPEAVEAAARAIAFPKLVPDDHDMEIARAALAAGVGAWPGVWGCEQEDACGVRRELILPLPQEARDEQ